MTDALWYLGRGSGVVSLVLLTVVVALGIGARSGRVIAGLPRFAVAAVHRAAGLLSVVFLAVHVLTLLFDPYAQLDLLALVVPFTAEAQPFWYGLGAVALDLVLALAVTGMLRHRIGPRTWKAVHLSAYAAWPVALAHGLGSGSDAGSAWMLALTGLCVATVLASVGWRLSPHFSEAGHRAEAARPTEDARTTGTGLPAATGSRDELARAGGTRARPASAASLVGLATAGPPPRPVEPPRIPAPRGATR